MAVIDTRGGRVKEVDPDIRARSSVPTYQSNENLKLGRVPQINATAFAAPGRALERAGAAISGAADRLGALSDKQNNFKDALNFTNLQNNLNMEYLNHTQTSSEDGVDFAKGWQQKQQQLTDEFLGGVSPKNKDRYKVNVAGVTGRHSLRAAEDEYNTRNQYQTKKLAGHVLTQSQILLKSPTPEALEDAVQSKDMLIDSMSISPSRKAALKRQNGLMLRARYIEGLEKKDPMAAKAELQKLRSEIGETFKASGKEAKNSQATSTKLPNNAVGQALGAAAQRHGVNPDVIASITKIESNFNPRAKNPNSSARGLGQFINSTGRQYGLKNDGSDSIQAQSDALARFTKDNITVLKRNLKRDPTPGEVYLAHFAGVGRAQAIGRASDNTPISKVLSQKAIAANRSILQGKTVGQVKAWAARKMGGTVSTKVSEAAYVPPKIDKMLNGIEKRIDKAVVERQELVVKDALKGKPSAAIEIMVDGYRDQLDKDPNNSGLQQAVKVGDKYLKQQKSALKNDPLKYADDQGLVDVPSIFAKPDIGEALAERLPLVEQVKDTYGIEPVYLKEDERAHLSYQFQELGFQEKMQFIARIEKGAKGKAGKIFNEIAGTDPAMAHIGGLFLTGRTETATLAMRGLELSKDKALRDVVANLKEADITAAYQDVFGNTFSLSQMKKAGPFITTSKSIAIALMAQGKHTDPADALKEGLKLATGQREINGDQYGGIIEFNGQRVMLHPDHKADDVEELFDFLTSRENHAKTQVQSALGHLGVGGLFSPKDNNEDINKNALNYFLQKDGVNPTNPLTQRPVTAEEMNDAKFVSVGPGRFLIMIDGVALKDTRTTERLNETNNLFRDEYVLDLSGGLEESLKLMQ